MNARDVMPAGMPVPSIGYLIWHLSLRWRGELDRALEPHGLSGASYAILASLYAFTARGAKPSQRELADFCGLEPMYVSKLTRALAAAGLLERTDNPADTRALQLRITDRGIAAVNAGRAVVVQLEEQRLAPLGGRSSQASVELQQMLLILLRLADAPGGGNLSPG